MVRYKESGAQNKAYLDSIPSLWDLAALRPAVAQVA